MPVSWDLFRWLCSRVEATKSLKLEYYNFRKNNFLRKHIDNNSLDIWNRDKSYVDTEYQLTSCE